MVSEQECGASEPSAGHVAISAFDAMNTAKPVLRLVAIASMVLTLNACGAGDRADNTPPATTVDTVAVQTQQPADRIIAPDRLGAVQRGMSVGELRAALAGRANIGTPDDRFMVDLIAMPITMMSDTLFYLLFPAGASVTDTTSIEFVATLNPAFRTAEGVGPGTTIRDASTRYGAATLSYNVNDESREYVSFASFQHPSVLFRVTPVPNSSFAGRYSTSGEYNETAEYDEAATIMMVLVNLHAR